MSGRGIGNRTSNNIRVVRLVHGGTIGAEVALTAVAAFSKMLTSLRSARGRGVGELKNFSLDHVEEFGVINDGIGERVWRDGLL